MLGEAQVVDFLLAEAESLSGKSSLYLIEISDRWKNECFRYNPGLSSRFPHRLKFDHFDNTELMQNMQTWIKRTYKMKMTFNDGLGVVNCCIASHRIEHERGHDSFANARAVENDMAKISEGQSKRLTQ